MTTDTSHIRHRLTELNHYIDTIYRVWRPEDYKSLLKFYVRMIPQVIKAERCTIFSLEPGESALWSMYGTGIEERAIAAPTEGTLVGRCMQLGEPMIDNKLEEQPGFHHIVSNQTGFITRSNLCAPIRSLIHKKNIGVIQVLNKTQGGFSQEDIHLLAEIAHYLALALEYIMLDQEIRTISKMLNEAIADLPESPMIAESTSMRSITETIKMVAVSPVGIHIHGDNGTGKELIARMIHHNSPRRDHTFVAINCAAIPETLMESEFFGHEKGAFTGAVASRSGRFEEAQGGTIFLDEIAEMPLPIQAKFLRVLQEGEGSRLGSNKLRRYDFRVISASNRDLRTEVAAGRFREDLFYRLFAVEIKIPPLKERRDDIIPLALAFFHEIRQQFHKHIPGFSQETLLLLESSPWPGNVRQLRREIERLVALTPEGEWITPETCSPELHQATTAPVKSPSTQTTSAYPTQESGQTNTETPSNLSIPNQTTQLEKSLIHRALHQTKGNKIRAAKLLQITRQGLDKKLKRYNLTY